ncbi:MAG: glycosyltransferase family 4 protein [Actinomycetota bacterium]|nr:glycosyltransferase family 4 protein [Actinomycetota bacterium]
MSTDRLAIALLSYRGNPHSGGQGVYVRYLSKALTDLGHRVEVVAGPPYPDLHEGVSLTKLPSLDLYRAGDPFRRPHLNEFRGAIDVLEYALMCTAAFPEPVTFSLRAARALRARRGEFDVIHDNQCLGYGLLQIQSWGAPVVATIHHPCSIDRDLEIAAAPSRAKRMSLRRWYSFTRMQGRVARRLPRLICVSESARLDVLRQFRVEPKRTGIVHNGVDAELFRPLEDVPKVAGRIVTTSSSELPLKGLVHLVEAVAKLRTERAVELVVVGKRPRRGTVAAALERYGLQDAVRFESGLDWGHLVQLYSSAEVAVVPSLYEGFSLPAIEAMSCAVPVVATTGGALPEVVGEDGTAGLLVPPSDAEALSAAIRRLLDDRVLQVRMGTAGRERVLDRFTWRAAAGATVAEYRKALGAC